MLFIHNIKTFIQSNNSSTEVCSTSNSNNDTLWQVYSTLINYYFQYTYKNYNTYSTGLPHYEDLDVYKIESNKQLDFCIHLNKNEVQHNEICSIEYVEETGANYGGIKRHFFYNLEKQLNKHISIINKINILKLNKLNYEKRLNAKIKHLSKLKNKYNANAIKHETNLSNIQSKTIILNKYKENMPKFNRNKNEEIDRETHILEQHMEIFRNPDIIVKILAFSKKYRQPIFVNNNEFKTKILNILVNISSPNIETKILLYNFLLNKKGVILSPSSICKKNNNINNNIDESLKEQIKIYIDLTIYQDILDFYLSHFFKFIICVDDILQKLHFTSDNININEPECLEFKIKFKLLLNSLNEKELELFNTIITGGSSLENKYTIDFKISNSSHLPVFKTCFSTMYIYNYKTCPYTLFPINGEIILDYALFEKCKISFLDLLTQISLTGFHIV